MAYEDKQKKEATHHVIMEGRERLSVSGVDDVDSFDESKIVMYTTKGMLTVSGAELHIERLSIEGGEVDIEGIIDSLVYTQEGGGQRGLFARLFK